MDPKDGIRQTLTRLAGAALAMTLLAAPVLPAAEIDSQRDLFRRVLPAAERGDWQAVDDLTRVERAQLEAYVLWPDLRAAWLRASLGKVTPAEVEAFLDRYGTLRPARELRYRYALQLADDGDFDRFLALYERFYQGRGIARLDCLALQGELKAGRAARIGGLGVGLWLVGTSQASECDPVFDHLDAAGLLGPVEYRRRYGLAVEAREFALARWLAKSIDEAHADEAERWVRAQSDPEAFLRAWKKTPRDEAARRQLVYAAERLTYRDPELALQLWNKVEKRRNFSAEQKLRTARHIALWTARDRLPGAYRLLKKLPSPAQNDEVMRWRARCSLREENWRRLVQDVDAMQAAERDTEEWRYWRAIGLRRSGRAAEADDDLVALAQERSYYGFLAADELDRDYVFDDDAFVPDEAILARLGQHPGLVRARELFFVGQDGRGRSEWDAVVRHLPEPVRVQAAILAHRWGWHSRAIAAASSLGEYDDLGLRYPLPHFETFASSASDARIPATWAYGVARSESLFMRDARSGAGAVGLMQLMPATGREVAREISLPYAGLTTLTDPVSNIRLGTSYLAQMASRYGGNRVLATAAYNAGPHRVDRWLPMSRSADARIWIENIPFNETRKYVKRVLAAQTIFHWRMTGTPRRLSDELTPIETASGKLQLATR